MGPIHTMAFANDGSFLEMMLKMQGGAAASTTKADEEVPSSNDEGQQAVDFIAAPWAGSKKGYIFQKGPKGLGYYPDPKGAAAAPAGAKDEANADAPTKKRPNVFAPSASSSLKKRKAQQDKKSEDAVDDRKASLKNAYLQMMQQNDEMNCRGDHKQGAVVK